MGKSVHCLALVLVNRQLQQTALASAALSVLPHSLNQQVHLSLFFSRRIVDGADFIAAETAISEIRDPNGDLDMKAIRKTVLYMNQNPALL